MTADEIGGKHFEEMTRDELIAALRERLRINVGLVTENKNLRAAAGKPPRDPEQETWVALRAEIVTVRSPDGAEELHFNFGDDRMWMVATIDSMPLRGIVELLIHPAGEIEENG